MISFEIVHLLRIEVYSESFDQYAQFDITGWECFATLAESIRDTSAKSNRAYNIQDFKFNLNENAIKR